MDSNFKSLLGRDLKLKPRVKEEDLKKAKSCIEKFNELNTRVWRDYNLYSIPYMLSKKELNRVKIVFVVPGYNEEGRVGKVLTYLKSFKDKGLVDEILYIDGGSKDKSVEEALEVIGKEKVFISKRYIDRGEKYYGKGWQLWLGTLYVDKLAEEKGWKKDKVHIIYFDSDIINTMILKKYNSEQVILWNPFLALGLIAPALEGNGAYVLYYKRPKEVRMLKADHNGIILDVWDFDSTFRFEKALVGEEGLYFPSLNILDGEGGYVVGYNPSVLEEIIIEQGGGRVSTYVNPYFISKFYLPRLFFRQLAGEYGGKLSLLRTLYYAFGYFVETVWQLQVLERTLYQEEEVLRLSWALMRLTPPKDKVGGSEDHIPKMAATIYKGLQEVFGEIKEPSTIYRTEIFPNGALRLEEYTYEEFMKSNIHIENMKLLLEEGFSPPGNGHKLIVPISSLSEKEREYILKEYLKAVEEI